MAVPERPGFERKDIHFGALAGFIGLLLFILAGAILLTRGFDRLLKRFAVVRTEPESPMADMHRLPPEPRLQVDPATDLIRLRDVENVTLTNYAWIDPSKGQVRIPIARAMAILAERGLPSRKGGAKK